MDVVAVLTKVRFGVRRGWYVVGKKALGCEGRALVTKPSSSLMALPELSTVF
jgi:hypothetical protein